jgi:type II secretory pathway component GspD/PulD (secretin)
MRKGTNSICLAMLAMLLAMPTRAAFAQEDTAKVPKERREAIYKVFYIKNPAELNDANEILTALRNLINPSAKVYMDVGQKAILIRSTPEDLELAQRIISDLDKARKAYRVTYTLTDMDGTKRVGTQHFSLNLTPGQRATLKDGSKIPVATGTYTAGSASSQLQMTYLDVGMNFDATLTEIADGGVLKSKVERSSIAEEKSGVGEQDPVVRQAVVDGTYLLPLGKPVMLGSMDIPASTRHLDIEVMLELVK